MLKCPECDGPVYDNRKAKTAGELPANRPDLKCKDKECGWVKWPPKDAKPAAPPAGKPVANGQPAPKMSWEDLALIYQRASVVARKVWTGTSVATDPSALAAATATVFIAAKDAGLRVPKKAPPPPPPDDVDLDAVPDALVYDGDDESLPF
jgi:hypothetical protein